VNDLGDLVSVIPQEMIDLSSKVMPGPQEDSTVAIVPSVAPVTPDQQEVPPDGEKMMLAPAEEELDPD
jgi:hypothetical protein